MVAPAAAGRDDDRHRRGHRRGGATVVPPLGRTTRRRRSRERAPAATANPDRRRREARATGVVTRRLDDRVRRQPDGSYHLFVIDPDGGNQTQLTSGSWNDMQPAWSPDGSRIAFSSNRDGSYHIYTMAADGSDVQRVTSGPWNDIEPTWSPDGGRIGFASNRGRDWDIFTVATDGHRARGTHVERRRRRAAGVVTRRQDHGLRVEPRWQLRRLHDSGRAAVPTPRRRSPPTPRPHGRRTARCSPSPATGAGSRRCTRFRRPVAGCSRRPTAPHGWTAVVEADRRRAHVRAAAGAAADIFWGIYSAPRTA